MTVRIFSPGPLLALALAAGTPCCVQAQDSVRVPALAPGRDSMQAPEAHPQDAPVDRGFFISAGDGSAELRLLGSIRLSGLVDFRGLQSTSTFNTYAIPVGPANRAERRFEMSARTSRLGIEVMQRAAVGDILVKVETDFLGGGGNLRLRHAYGTVHGFLVGQTWSAFGDPNSIPLTVDLDGPNSAVSARTVQARYSGSLGTGLTWAAAIESPGVEVAIPDSLGLEPSFQSLPDIIARMRHGGPWGHAQVAGVLRSLNVRSPGGDPTPLTALGFLVSGRLFLAEDETHRLLSQLVAGRGISRFISVLSGEGLDLAYNPATGSFDLTSALGAFLSYAREWSPSVLSHLTLGWIALGNIRDRPDDAFRRSMYISANLFWDPAAGTRLGGEFSWGRRVNKNGDTGTAARCSFNMRYDF